MAKHGLERNEYMRKEASANGENTDRDFAGLIGLTGEPDRQSAEATAKQIVDAYESTHDTGHLWQAVNAATKATLTTRYQGGLLSKDVYNELMTRYKFYVPLKGWEDATAADIYEYATDAHGLESALKGASGRNSLADDPLATIMVDAQRTIMEAQRNLMKQKFLNLALNHQTDLLTVSKQWYEKKNDGTWEVSNPDILPDDDADTIADKIKDHEAKMKALESQKLAKTKRNGLRLKLAKGDAEESQHVVRVKRNGETFLIYVNGDPRAALAINGMLAHKEITNVWSEVKDFYILRHNLTEQEAYMVESTIIDLLTYPAFNKENLLTNIVCGHHQWNEGIKTENEINVMYDCKKIEPLADDRLLLVSLNRSYDHKRSEGVYRRPNDYESARKYWKIADSRAKEVTHILGIYRGIVRIVIAVKGYRKVDQTEDGKPFSSPRYVFEGDIIADSPYLNTDVSDFPFGSGGAVTYIPREGSAW